MTDGERWAMSEEIARRECEAQGIPFLVDADRLLRLGRNLALWQAA